MYNNRSKSASITATILTKNAAETLAATLDSLKDFAEVLILDSGSTDETKEIACCYSNVRLLERPFQGFGKMHNLASRLATHDWILSVDSDEVLSDELIQEILQLKLDPKTVYSLNRHNYFQGKWITTCSGWYPDPVARLYHRHSTQFDDVAVHEKVISEHLTLLPLKGKLIHTPYRTIESFLTKMQLYSSLFADQNKGKPSSVKKAVWHGLAAFIKNYFFKRGFLGGREGFIISAYNAQTTYYKYLKLAFKK